MIERDFIAQKTKEFYIKQHIESTLKGVGISEIKLKKIPLGEKIIITAARPNLIVGSKGSNIRRLTKDLKIKFKLENPQIEISEVKDYFLDANIVAQRIASSLERFGSARFKGVGHKTMESVIQAGGLGVEILISGKIPGSRAKSWRFYQGYLKKCGDVAVTGVRSAKATALLKSGIIGIQVAIMPSDLVLPDSIKILEEPITIVEEIKVEKGEEKKKPAKKKTTKKKATKKDKEEVKVEEKVVEEAPKEELKTEVKEEAKVEVKEAKEESKSEDPVKEVTEEVKPEVAKEEKVEETKDVEEAEKPAAKEQE